MTLREAIEHLKIERGIMEEHLSNGEADESTQKLADIFDVILEELEAREELE